MGGRSRKPWHKSFFWMLTKLHNLFLCIYYLRCIYYFASAAVVVDYSHMTFVNGHVSTMWFMVCCWSQSHEGDWARPHLCKLARHGPWPVQKRFIRDHVWCGRSKPGCRIVWSVTVDHRSRRQLLSPLHNCVDRCHVWPYWVSRYKTWRWMLKDISIHANLDGLQWYEAYRQLPLYDVEKKVQHCWALAAMRAALDALNYEDGCQSDLAHTGQQYSATQ